jgi:membrane-associated phospholipid phosphatase
MLHFLNQIDIQLSVFFRGLVGPDDFLAPLVRFCSDIEVLLVCMLIVGLWVYGVAKREVGFKIIALDIFYTVLFGFIVYWILQLGLPMRPRPETLSPIPPLLNHLPDNSFPSGHAIFAGASVVAIGYFLNMRLSSLFAALGVIMLLSRVIAGVHYFGDVLAGVILGSLLARIWIFYRDSIGIKTVLHAIPLKIASFF